MLADFIDYSRNLNPQVSLVNEYIRLIEIEERIAQIEKSFLLLKNVNSIEDLAAIVPLNFVEDGVPKRLVSYDLAVDYALSDFHFRDLRLFPKASIEALIILVDAVKDMIGLNQAEKFFEKYSYLNEDPVKATMDYAQFKLKLKKLKLDRNEGHYFNNLLDLLMSSESFESDKLIIEELKNVLSQIEDDEAMKVWVSVIKKVQEDAEILFPLERRVYLEESLQAILDPSPDELQLMAELEAEINLSSDTRDKNLASDLTQSLQNHFGDELEIDFASFETLDELEAYTQKVLGEKSYNLAKKEFVQRYGFLTGIEGAAYLNASLLSLNAQYNWEERMPENVDSQTREELRKTLLSKENENRWYKTGQIIQEFKKSQNPIHYKMRSFNIKNAVVHLHPRFK